MLVVVFNLALKLHRTWMDIKIYKVAACIYIHILQICNFKCNSWFITRLYNISFYSAMDLLDMIGNTMHIHSYVVTSTVTHQFYRKCFKCFIILKHLQWQISQQWNVETSQIQVDLFVVINVNDQCYWWIWKLLIKLNICSNYNYTTYSNYTET